MTFEVKVLALGSSLTRLPQLYVDFLMRGKKQNDSYSECDGLMDGRTEIRIGNQVHGLEILTNIGMEEFHTLSNLSQCEGFILMYNTNSRNSFEVMKSYYNRIVLGKDTTELNICVIALTFEVDQEQLSIVPKSEGEEFAKAIQANFYEGNSWNETIFSDIIKRVPTKVNPKQKAHHSKSPLKRLFRMIRTKSH